MRRQYVSLMNQAPESIINGQVVKGQGELTDSRVIGRSKNEEVKGSRGKENSLRNTGSRVLVHYRYCWLVASTCTSRNSYSVDS